MEHELNALPANGLRAKLDSIFKSAQESRCSHQKCIVAMNELYKNNDPDIFLKEFIDCLTILLHHECKQPSIFVQRLFDFISTFCTKFKPTPETNNSVDTPFVKEVIKFLVQVLRIDTFVVRYNACQLLHVLFEELSGSVVSEELFETLQGAMLNRLRDPKTEVCIEAMNVLRRLQDPSDPNDPVIYSYIMLMSSPNSKVRKCAVENIALVKQTVPHCVNVTRDVAVKVRLAAYMKLSKAVKALKIIDRQHVLLNGFQDTDKQVNNYINTKFVFHWLDAYGNYFSFLKALRLDGYGKDVKLTTRVTEYVLDAIFRQHQLKDVIESLRLSESSTIPYEHLSWESAFFWRKLVLHVRKYEHFEDFANKIVPEIIPFCEYLKGYSEWQEQAETEHDVIEEEYITEQLLIIIHTYDLQDEAIRQYLIGYFRQYLQSKELNISCLKLIMQIFEIVMPKVTVRCMAMCEIISEILCPADTKQTEKNSTEREFEMAQLRVKLQELKMAVETAVNAEDFRSAEKYRLQKEECEVLIQEKLAKMENEPDTVKQPPNINTICRCLDIAYVLLLSGQITELLPSLMTLKKNVIQDYLIHENTRVVVKALKCFILLGIIDQDCARVGFQICLVPIQAYHSEKKVDDDLLVTSIEGITDMLLVYGTQFLTEPDEADASESLNEQHQATFKGGTALTDIIQNLVDIMYSDNPEVEVACVRVLCKLLISERIYSPSLMSRLILKWATPFTDSTECTIKRLIGETVQHLAIKCTTAEELDKAVLSTIRDLVRAPAASPLQEVYSDVLKLLAALCSISPLSSQIQTKLAVYITDFILTDPCSQFSRAYSQFLVLLDIPYEKSVIEDLLEKTSELRDAVENKVVVNNILKFEKNLKEIYNKNNNIVKPSQAKKGDISEDDIPDEQSENETEDDGSDDE